MLEGCLAEASAYVQSLSQPKLDSRSRGQYDERDVCVCLQQSCQPFYHGEILSSFWCRLTSAAAQARCARYGSKVWRPGSYVAALAAAASAAAAASRYDFSRMTTVCWPPDAAIVMSPRPNPFNGFCQRMSPVAGSRRKNSPLVAAYRSPSWRNRLTKSPPNFDRHTSLPVLRSRATTVPAMPMNISLVLVIMLLSST